MTPENAAAVITALGIAVVLLAYTTLILVLDRCRFGEKPAPKEKPEEIITAGASRRPGPVGNRPGWLERQMTRRAELMVDMTIWILSHATDEIAEAFRETLRLADEAERLHERDIVHEDHDT